MAGWTRDTPWRQGNVLTKEAADKAGLTRQDSPSPVFVVVSHDCDITQPPETEPCVEILAGHPVDASDGNCTHAKNPRKLHLSFTFSGGELVVEMRAAEKIQVPKEALAGFEPNRGFSLPWERLSILQRWLALRYRRAAFPDAFNERFSGMRDKLARILDPLGEDISAVFFDIDEGEEIKREAPEDTYTLEIYLLYDTGRDPKRAEDGVAEASKKIRKAFRDKFFIAGRGWEFIELRDCVPFADNAMTYRHSTLLKRWNIDYISLRDPSQAQPVE